MFREALSPQLPFRPKGLFAFLPSLPWTNWASAARDLFLLLSSPCVPSYYRKGKGSKVRILVGANHFGQPAVGVPAWWAKLFQNSLPSHTLTRDPCLLLLTSTPCGFPLSSAAVPLVFLWWSSSSDVLVPVPRGQSALIFFGPLALVPATTFCPILSLISRPIPNSARAGRKRVPHMHVHVHAHVPLGPDPGIDTHTPSPFVYSHKCACACSCVRARACLKHPNPSLTPTHHLHNPAPDTLFQPSSLLGNLGSRAWLSA